MTPQTKLVFKLSDAGWSGVEDLCQSQARLATSTVDSQEAADAYAAYTMRKKELLEYISDLELRCRERRQTRVMSVFTTLSPTRNESGYKDSDSKDNTKP